MNACQSAAAMFTAAATQYDYDADTIAEGIQAFLNDGCPEDDLAPARIEILELRALAANLRSNAHDLLATPVPE